MGKLSPIETMIANDTTALLSSTKVCMHVLEAARDDPRVMREATALVEEGFKVSIVDVEGDCNQPIEEETRCVYMKHIIMPVSFVTTRFTKWTLVRATQLLIRGTLRLIQTPADIYHAHNEAALPACYIASRIRRKPLIFDAHELPLDNTSIRWHWLLILFTRLLAVILPRCVGVITVSDPIAQEIRNRYRVPEVSLVRNVPAYRSIPKSDLLRQYLGLGPDVRIALYQGNLQPKRGLDRLIGAAPFLEQNILIVLMGQGPKKTLSQLEALIVSEGVADRVKILPAVPYEELLDWTASADIGLNILPPDYSLSIRWCLPNKLFEYLMAGIPVLTSELEAVVEVIKTYDVGQVVSSLAPADIGAAINNMLADPVALASMRRNALDAAQYVFNWEKEKQQLFRLYHEILSRKLIKKRK
jgi:glycosyltransferase involved in cell wall biosynthesis